MHPTLVEISNLLEGRGAASNKGKGGRGARGGVKATKGGRGRGRGINSSDVSQDANSLEDPNDASARWERLWYGPYVYVGLTHSIQGKNELLVIWSFKLLRNKSFNLSSTKSQKNCLFFITDQLKGAIWREKRIGAKNMCQKLEAGHTRFSWHFTKQHR